MWNAWLLVAFVLLAASARGEPAVTAAGRPALSDRLVGGAQEYAARSGDSLTSIGARFGVDVATLARANALAVDARLALGQRLRVENPHVVPSLAGERFDDGILINVPQRMLFLLRGGRVEAGHPIAAGRPSWRTPLGELEIDERAIDKTWIVPRSIQEEMRREGRPVLTTVPPGPENPLGRHWLGLSRVSCGIHSTNAPESIYSLRTHGCIRLHADDAEALYASVGLGERVRIVYQPVLLAALPDGRICLEAHADAYGAAPPAETALDELVAQGELADRVDRRRALEVLMAREGIARDVTLGSSGESCT